MPLDRAPGPGRKRLYFFGQGPAAVGIGCDHGDGTLRAVDSHPCLCLRHLTVVSEAVGERLRVTAVQTPAGCTYALSPVDPADLMPDWGVIWTMAPTGPADRAEMLLALDVPADATVGPEEERDARPASGGVTIAEEGGCKATEGRS